MNSKTKNMKKLSFILLLLFCLNSLYSQKITYFRNVLAGDWLSVKTNIDTIKNPDLKGIAKSKFCITLNETDNSYILYVNDIVNSENYLFYTESDLDDVVCENSLIQF